MKITKLEIHNYRNLDGVHISLEENCNFIVGENNLGKSNLLSLVNILFTSRAFRLDDFKNASLPIEINFQLKLAPIEIGHFQDLFDLDDYSLINITARQDNIDDNIVFFHTETTTYIQPSVVKCLNYIHYDSLRNPVAEINFDKGRGVGRFLRNIISQYLIKNGISDADFLDDSKVNELLSSINEKIVKIKSFQDFGIKASTEDDAENLLSKIVVLKDGKGDSFLKTGYGVQFLILVTLSVLEKLQAIRAQRGDRGIFEDETDGKKSISLIIGLDEPEIHLHPYMQRSLIKYLNSVITNKNAEFKTLIRELFDIDEFIGQVIVVTHSPNILLNDYKQIIRFYSELGVTKIISGSQFNLGEQLHKHLYLHFPFIKEAFFSRCAIFVEGDSEFSSFPLFGKKLSIEFDDLGICVIQAGGDAIHQLIELAIEFGIPSVGVSDKDNGTSPTTLHNHFQTNLRDYEEEIVCHLIDSGKEELLRNILKDKDERWLTRKLEKESLNKRLFSKSGQDKYNLGISKFEVDLILTNIDLDDLVSLKSFYLTWFILNKSYPLGMLIGQHLSISEIPAIYQTVITEAKKLVANV
jgi:putative ATP-dependent endonuclease of OLD family